MISLTVLSLEELPLPALETKEADKELLQKTYRSSLTVIAKYFSSGELDME
jgi:hypothetical protein